MIIDEFLIQDLRTDVRLPCYRKIERKQSITLQPIRAKKELKAAATVR